MTMQQRSSPQAGAKRLRQQQLQIGASSVDRSSGGGGDKRPQRFWPCPVCNRSFARFRLEDHVNRCLDSSPCPQTSRSSPRTTGDVSCPSPASELHPAAPIQGRDECPDVPTSPGSSSVSSVKTNKKSSFTDSVAFRAQSDSKSEAVLLSDHQRSGLARLKDADCLSTQMCASLETNFLQTPEANAVESVQPGHVRHPFARLQDAHCLSTERFLSLEDSLLLPPDENVVDGGRGGFEDEEEEDGGNGLLRCKLEYMGGDESRDYGNRDCSAENPWTLDVGCLDERGVVEDERGGIGVATDRPPAGFKLFQRQVQSQARLSMFRNFSSAPLQRKPSVTVLQPGMVLFRSWLDLDTQQKFVLESQGVAHLFRRPTTAGGGKYHVYSMCWGSKWDAKAHRYAPKSPELSIPSWMFDLAQKLARDAHEHTPVYPVDAIYAPDVGLVNFYPVKADELGVIGLGGHQDLDDSGLMPVVSVSVGDSMTFFYRRLPPFSRRKSGVSISVDEEAARSCQDGDAAHNREHQILLESGDVLVFGGKSRLVYHGTRNFRPSSWAEAVGIAMSTSNSLAGHFPSSM